MLKPSAVYLWPGCSDRMTEREKEEIRKRVAKTEHNGLNGLDHVGEGERALDGSNGR